jgi:hypothetical protein
MARRTRSSDFELLGPLIQIVICGAGLLGGIAGGALIVFGTGLLIKFGEALSLPLGSVTAGDLLVIVGSIAIVAVFGWLGARIGIFIAAKIQP